MVKGLRQRILPLEYIVGEYFCALEPPVMVDIGTDRQAWRYESPGIDHYCLLKLSKVVSTMNASIELVIKNYNYEICVLVRTILEDVSHIDYILDINDDPTKDELCKSIIQRYFSDSDRSVGEIVYGYLKQSSVHDYVGDALDSRIADHFPEEKLERPASQHMRYLYSAFSNYVHGRYPEIMDIFGGNPMRFNTNGLPVEKSTKNLLTLSRHIWMRWTMFQVQYC